MSGDGTARAQRGYTLVELLVVVIMVGVLATLATIGVRKYIFASKTSEAINMIGSIKAAQEAYKDETFSYLDVSKSLTSDFYPKDPGKEKHHWVNESHADSTKWRALGVSTPNPVQFGYATRAGIATDPIPQPGTAKAMEWPPANGPWYVVVGVSDLNANGVKSIYVSSSFTGEIYGENEGE